MQGFLRNFIWLFNPFGVIISTITGIVVTKVIVGKIKKNRERHVGIKILFCKIGCCLLVFASYYVFMSDFSKPSQVDIAPLEQLEAKSFYSKDEVKDLFKKLEYEKDVAEFQSRFSSEDELLLYNVLGGCSYQMYTSNANIYISIDIHDLAVNAQLSFNSAPSYAIIKKRELIKISDEIDVILFYSAMYRASDQLLPYNDSRYVNTYIRIGNITIIFMETENVLDEIGALTSKNIELLCEMLGK